jgi:hypothetical protein
MTQRIIEQIDDSLFYLPRQEIADRLLSAEQDRARLMRVLVRLLSACDYQLALSEDATPEFRQRVLEIHAEVTLLAGADLNADSEAKAEVPPCAS